MEIQASIQAFLEGITIFRIFAGTETGFAYPGFWASIGFLIVAAVLVLVLRPPVNFIKRSDEHAASGSYPESIILVVGESIELLGGFVLRPEDENPNSNQSRNVLFELSLAALLKRAGLAPQLGEHPDVRCHLENRLFFFECKRPFSARRVAERIGEAGNQLLLDLEAHGSPRARGIVVVSVEKILTPSQGPFSIPDESTARGFLDAWLEAMASETASSWMEFRQIEGIAGIMFHAIAVFLNEKTIGYEAGQQWLGISLSTPDDESFLRLGEMLQSVAY